MLDAKNPRVSGEPEQQPLAEEAGAGGAPLVRLNKYMADHGVASRRACDLLIVEGHVSVDGDVVVELGTRIDPERARVEVDGQVLESKGARHRYYLLHKPAGVVCTSDARESRQRAIDLITDRNKGRIYTVGRLDEETTGLVLLTNDGDFANRIMHPRFGVSKTYEVKLVGRIDDESLRKVREGVHLSEGRTSGARVVVVKRSDRFTHLLVSVQEGMNREIRRIFARVGFKVTRLHRGRIGNIDDRGLKPGQWRPLTRAEIEALQSPERDEQSPSGRKPAGATRGAARPASRSALRPPQPGDKRPIERRAAVGRPAVGRPAEQRPGNRRPADKRKGGHERRPDSRPAQGRGRARGR